MARIIYKEDTENHYNLEGIEGIEINLLNGQKALVYPKYSERMMLPEDKIYHWNEKDITEIESLKKEDTVQATEALLRCGSPAAEYVSNFRSNKHGTLNLPSLLAAMEISHQMKDIDKLAELIDGADLLQNFDSYIWTCFRYNKNYGWVVFGNGGFVLSNYLCNSHLIVPIALYR